MIFYELIHCWVQEELKDFQKQRDLGLTQAEQAKKRSGPFVLLTPPPPPPTKPLSLTMFCVVPCGDFISSVLLHLVRTLVNNIQRPDLVTPLKVSSFLHVPFQITLKSKTKREKCIPGVFAIHARSHKNNTSSGAPFNAAIGNIWGNSNEKHCASQKPRRFVSLLAPSSFSPSLMSDFDVDKMIEKQSAPVQFNSDREYVSWDEWVR